MKISRNFILSMAALALIFVAPLTSVTPAAAIQPAQQFAACSNKNMILGLFKPWYACLPGADQGEPRIESLEQTLWIIFPLLESLVKIGAIVAASMMFYALFNMITARGNMQKIAKSVETIRDSVIGFVICLVAVAIVDFVASQFTVLPPH